jgi:spheroidene monooxygenase
MNSVVSNSGQCAVLQLLKFSGTSSKTWGSYQMILARMFSINFPGLQFIKPLGIGSGHGYRAWPEWDASGFFMVFENVESALAFRKSTVMAEFLKKSTENYAVFMSPISSRGSWSGFDQWEIMDSVDMEGPVCSLTRATLKPQFLYKFWKMVSPISLEQKDYPGLIFSQGIGEVPLVEQATFTIWENKKSLEDFARNTFHGDAVREVYRLGGFKEQMFTRFKPFHSEGKWDGKDALAPFLAHTPNTLVLQEV